MKINAQLKDAVKKMNYITATDVQVESIKFMLDNKNVVVKSHTGSGKTAAFGIPLSENILNGKSKGAVILCPTRELAVQVKDELRKLNSNTRLSVSAVYGGHGLNSEIKAFEKGIDILCATPGRLLDHIKHNAFDPKFYDTVVLDEADRMLDMGFINDIKEILHSIRPMNTHLFSATLEGSVTGLIREYIREYEEIIIPQEIIGKNILERHVKVGREERFNALMDVIKEANNNRVLVFVSTKRTADTLAKKLHHEGIKVECIHGDKSQRAREFALQNFKTGRNKVLVAPDVASRGLQIDNVEFVVNYDLAADHDTHKHRIGRTGRMGDTGHAVSFVNETGSIVEPKKYFKKDSRGGGRGFSGNRGGFRGGGFRGGGRSSGGSGGSRWNSSDSGRSDSGRSRGSGDFSSRGGDRRGRSGPSSRGSFRGRGRSDGY